MATSYRRFTFSGSVNTVDVTMGYLSRDHISVKVGGTLVLPSTYTWLSDAQIQLGSMPTAGTTGEVRRTTPGDPLTDFQPGNLDSSDLNYANLQALYLAAEAADRVGDTENGGWYTTGGGTGGSITKSASGSVPVFDTDGNLTGNIPGANISGAAASATAAAASASTASGAATTATTAATLAQAWASNPEDVEVIPGAGLYSAYNWYRKSLAIYGTISNGLAGWIHAAAAKAPPVGADELGIADSAASFGLKKLTLTSLLAWLLPLVGPDYVSGMTTVPTSLSTPTSVSVNAGTIKGNSRIVTTAGGMSKSIFSVWAAGTGVGGRDQAGAPAANSTWFMHALQKNSDGSFDWTYSLSPTSPTVPSGYSLVGRFGVCWVDNSATYIVPYEQNGNGYRISTVGWYNTTSAVALAISTFPANVPVPLGISVDVTLIISTTCAAGGSVTTTLDQPNGSGSIIASGAGHESSTGVGQSTTVNKDTRVKTNTLRQVMASIAMTGSVTTRTDVNGWIDYTIPRIGA